MLIKIGNFDFTEVWDGVLYKKLSAYPEISDWEVRNLIEFIDYENAHGRSCAIECENEELLAHINEKSADRSYLNVPRPDKITECTACRHKGCLTDYVCHTTSLENAISILNCGSILSAVKARNLPAEQLAREKRNAAKDPADYFEYVMFSWGNCQAGDRLVIERKLGRFPNEQDLSEGFQPGIRFCFKYDELVKHPNAVFDGVLPLKIKDGVVLADWLYKIVIPTALKSAISIPQNLNDKVIFIENNCKDIWEWSEKVYSIIK